MEMHRAGRGVALKWMLSVFLALSLLFVSFLALVVFSHVWPPDIWDGDANKVADFKLPTGEHFVIADRWGGDFYYSHLLVTHPDGTENLHVIDGDGPKLWFQWHEYDPEKREVLIVLNNKRWARYLVDDQRLVVENDFRTNRPSLISFW